MIPISGVNTGAAQPLTKTEKVLGAPMVQKPEEESRPLKPVMDEYVPEEKQEPCGRYWVGKDEDGQPKIYFDDPERVSEDPQKPEADEKKPDAPEQEKPEQAQRAKGPKKKEGERCVGNTDKVDREIKHLKKKREELEQRLNTETDEAKIKDLERKLAQVERELSEKDNDTYRKQHSTFSSL